MKEQYAQGNTDYDNYMEGGRLVAALPEDLETTNPLKITSKESRTVMSLIYAGLFEKNPETLQDINWLACARTVEEIDPNNLESTPRAVTGDLLKITCNLRPETIEWHDGVELTSADVKFTSELMKDLGIGLSTYHGVFGRLTHVEAPDAKTVEFFFRRKGWISSLDLGFPILPEHIWENVTSPLEWNNPEPVGCGPFKWNNHIPGDKIVLVHNDAFILNSRNYLQQDSSSTASSDISTETSDSQIVSSSYDFFSCIAALVSVPVICSYFRYRKFKR